MTITDALNALFALALAEVGYMEKASNSNLYSKTGNAGSANYTKYWKDCYPAWNGQYWCAIFVYWLFVKTFGEETAKKLLKHGPYVYCPTLAGMTTNHTPKVGSIVLFWKPSQGAYGHTGLVIDVTDTTITTIEGNTSGDADAKDQVVSNGGSVCRKVYTRSKLNSNNKYFMPDYSIVTSVSSSITTDTATTTSEASANESRASSGINRDKTLSGIYRATTAVYGHKTPDVKDSSILAVVGEGVACYNYGYYGTLSSGKKMLSVWVPSIKDKTKNEMFISEDYLKKE